MRVEGEWPTSVMHHRGEGSSTGRRARLPLVLRMALLQRRGARPASLGEQGYALAVALAAAFVLLLGVGALASRGNLGFIGQVFQVQNRRARDVAESAIREFADVLNREENRHLLIAGTTSNWGTTDFQNICTAVNANGLVDEISDGVPDIDSPVGYDDFVPVGVTPSDADWKARGTGKDFVVEEIQFLNELRQSYLSPNDIETARATIPRPGRDLTPTPSNRPYLDLFRSGSRRALIRITVVGRVNENGRISTARVAREFEVVPKCCKRSFGPQIGGTNWGRDLRSCPTGSPAEYGIIAGMNGSEASGSNNGKPIITQSNAFLSEAGCWAGGEVLGDSTVQPNSTCTSKESNVADISFNPIELIYNQPDFIHPAGNSNITAQVVNVTGVSNGIIYFDPGTRDPDQSTASANSGLLYQRDTNPPTRLDGTPADGTATTPDPCYSQEFASGSAPYYSVNCKIISLNPQGSTKIYVDTSAAQINIFFEGDGDASGQYGVGTGSSGVYRIHNFVGALDTDECTPGQLPTRTNPCSRATLTTQPPDTLFTLPLHLTQHTLYSAPWINRYSVKWTSVDPGTPITNSSQRLNNYLEFCGDRPVAPPSCNEDLYAIRRLLNFYASGTGAFNIYGSASGLAYNIYAPKATVRLNGGGKSDQFMGQIWTDTLIINGDIQISTFSGTGEDGTYNGIQLIDFMARSFSQSSGF